MCVFTANRTVKYGATVTLHCKGTSKIDVKWTQTDINSHIYDIYSNGSVLGSIRNRFSITSTVRGEYNLMMQRANPSDAGLYVCDEWNQTLGSPTLLSQYYLTIPGITVFLLLGFQCSDNCVLICDFLATEAV